MDICIFHAETKNICLALSNRYTSLIHTCTSMLELEKKYARSLSSQEKSKGFYKNSSLSMQGILFLCVCEGQMQTSNTLNYFFSGLSWKSYQRDLI